MPIYDTHTRSVVVWPQTEVCSRGVRCGSRVCASNHCARCVRAHGVHVHRMHVLLTDERNHARDSDRMRCLKHPLLRGRARLLWACAIVYTVVFQPVRLLLFREVSLLLALSLARSFSLARRARTLSPHCFPDRQAHLAERERERARARERERYRHAHTHTCTLTRTHTS